MSDDVTPLLNPHRRLTVDATFDEATEIIEAIRSGELKRLRTMRAALVELRRHTDPGLDCCCHGFWTDQIEAVLALAPIGPPDAT